MRQRITFVHAPDKPYNPENLKIEKTRLLINDLVAAREDKGSFAIDELPQEISSALRLCHEIHIRWVSPTYYPTVSPFSSRLSPGLHISYTPLKDKPNPAICPLLRKVFSQELRCQSPEVSFTPAPVLSERFATAASYNFYQYVKWPSNLIAYIGQNVCQGLGAECAVKGATLADADYMDMDYDAVSQSLVIKSFRQVRERKGPWSEIVQATRDSRLEVGILSTEAPSEGAEPETLKMSGFLVVVGEDSQPNPTLFEFPSRHHRAPMAATLRYSASFLKPSGLHPTLRISFDSFREPQRDQCTLHAYLTLPSVLFIDKYQLESPLFRASKNLGPIRALSGETDLEAPNWAVEKWGSAMLIELAPTSTIADRPWNADIPLHLRYLPPAKGGMSHAKIPWPIAFWACRAEEGTKMNTNPFDRTNSGYEGLFGPKTMFYHLSPNQTKTDGLVEGIDVPVLDSDSNAWSGPVASLIIAAGAVWVLLQILQVATKAGKTTDNEQRSKPKTQ